MSELEFINQQHTYHPIQQLCHALGVVTSRYYAWRMAQAVGATG